MIRVEHLQKYYNKGKKNEQHVLDDVNLELGETGLVCILGESGSGKTTLLNTIGGLDEFSEGCINMNGTELTQYDPSKVEPIRNEHFGYIFQNYYLLPDFSVGYNVKLALSRYDLTEEEKEYRVSYVLDMLGMAKYKKKLVSKLSGGQQQRVSIARALVKSPDIIMADEPTGNLDEENTLRTMSILKSISKSCLVLLVTHEKRIARFFADRIIEVSDGKIIRDEVNHAAKSYERMDDANIYLQDMDCLNLQNNCADFRIYCEKGQAPQPVHLGLAWRDGKLYIQNRMNCDVLLEGAANGVQMLDAERPKLEAEDLENFAYDLPKITSARSAELSRREIWRMAVENIRLMGKKQAFVIVILIVTAVLLSVTVAEFVDTVSIDESSFVSTDTHYLYLDFARVSNMRGSDQQWQILDYTWNYLDDDGIGEMFYAPEVNVYLQGQGYAQIKNILQKVTGYSFADLSHVTEEQLLYGELPQKRDEIVVDISVIERLIASKGVISTLYGGPESYLGVKLSVVSASQYMTITGICDTGEPDIYASQNLMLGLGQNKKKIASVAELQAAFPEEYQKVKLADDEILIREGLLASLQIGEENCKVGGTYQIGDDVDHIYTIVGTFADDMDVDYVLNDKGCQNIRDLAVYDNKNCYIYVEDTQKAMELVQQSGKDYQNSFRLNVTNPYKDEIAAYREAHTIDFRARGLITFVIAAISLIMVYFTIKSNATSRSEELTVYRLIGISKNSIRKAYMLEMALITCYTSLPAVLLTSGVIKFISGIPSLEIGMIFPWWSVVLLLVMIYLVHMIISILPVSGILSKPPAMLAVKD